MIAWLVQWKYSKVGTDKDANAFLGSEGLDVVVHSDDFGLEGECHFPAVWWQVVRDGVLDDTEQLFLRCRGTDG